MAEKQIGCPPRYKSVEEMQEKIDAYFEDCAGKYITDEEGNLMTDKYGNPVKEKEKPLTITGLALALGFTTRQALLNYQGKPAFVDTITRAKSRVEQYTEERLFDKDGANGARFSLTNNFRGWSEKQHIEADVKKEITIDIELTDED